jgi:hypothetical protein
MHPGGRVRLFLLVLFAAAGIPPAIGGADIAGHQSIAVTPRSGGQPGFTALSPRSTGIWFTNRLEGDARLTNAVAHNGSGVAIGDVDGDGWQDVYLCGLEEPNHLYRNLGNWRFARTDAGPASCENQYSSGAVFADVDGDSDLDLMVNGIAAGTRLFLNDGTGRWTESTNSGLSITASATSMALADMDGDGDLDLYCTHYIDVMHLADPTTTFAVARRGNQWEVTKVNGQSTRTPRWKGRFHASADGKVRELPEADALYRNEGGGRFTAVNDHGSFLNELGEPISLPRDWGLAVTFRDLNGDRAPDLYVCNDNASPDRVWINSGNGTFRPIDTLKIRHTSRSSMGIDVADINRDGLDDLMIVDMLAREHSRRLRQRVRDLPDPEEYGIAQSQPRFNRNTLFLGRPRGSYTEAALWAGVAASDWSWCPAFLDVDLDGYEDLLVTTGFEFDVMDQDSHDLLRRLRLADDQRRRSMRFHPRWPSPIAAFRNRRDGTFEPVAADWGFTEAHVSHGMAMGDLDNDGDMDLVVAHLNEAAGLYCNNAPGGRVAVRLRGHGPNTQGIGTRVRLIGPTLVQSQEIMAGGRYLSGDQAMRVFAMDAGAGEPWHLEVHWRNGGVTSLEVECNRIYEIAEVPGSPTNAVRSTAVLKANPYFTDVSLLLQHKHSDSADSSTLLQPTLTHGMGRLGPGLSWFDVNDDGWEDLTIASGEGGTLAIYTNSAGRTFQQMQGTAHATADQGAVLGWRDRAGRSRLLVASGMDDPAAKPTAGISEFHLPDPTTATNLPGGPACTGPLACADFDGDGDLDLFAGGRLLPGRYPEPATSTIWLQKDDEWQPSPEWSATFKDVGLVNGATVTELDDDGRPDLALALDWGSLRVYRNNGHSFDDVTEAMGLGDATGWWAGITSADFDGDSRLDLAAANWGRNSIYELHGPGPLRLYYSDVNGDGTVELIEAWESEGRWFPIHDRAQVARGFPWVSERFPTHSEYAKAEVREVLGLAYSRMRTLEVRQRESAVFLNRFSSFERVPLPHEAQLAPAFAVLAADFNSDGNEDLFLSQNYLGATSYLTRDGGGRGLWLRGNGDGTFKSLDATESGIEIFGEQRGAAVADFNHDGRIDLAVSQNNGVTRLFRNQGVPRGLRVRLSGPPANPDAVGAQIRVRYGSGRSGPVRFIHAGTGYWSQDGSSQVVGMRERPGSLWIRWPGGREQTVPLDPDKLDLHVTWTR